MTDALPPESDLDLVRSVLSGNKEAYAGLIRANMDHIYTFCLSLLSNPTEAEDAAQDVFVKAYRSLPGFKGNSRFSTWLTRIAYNHCMDLLRKKARHKTESWDALVEQQGGEKMTGRPADEGAAAAAKEKAALAHRLLSRLPDDYRTILTLRETQELSYEEIMRVMDCSLDSVKARLRRARAMLKELFEEQSKEKIKRGL